jgi:hypothetical protein
MYGWIMGSVGGLVGKWDKACIDNHVFRLHYRASFIICLASSLLVTSKQFVGNPINCMSEGVSGGIMDIYCWIHSTFSVPGQLSGEKGIDNAHPGVAPLDGEDVLHHKYYQWVVFVLSLQAGMFYLPRFIWKNSEGGIMKLLTNSLNDVTDFLDGDKRKDGVEFIAKYFRSEFRRGSYFCKFILCECLNFINVLGQIYFTDRFLGYQFTTYGLDVLNKSEENFTERDDAMNRVFPKIAKCTFHKYGPSGTIQNHDGLCVLPLNIINEKIYCFLWFWFVFLAAITGVWLLYRMAIIFFLDLRVSTIYYRAEGVVDKRQISATLNNPNHGYIQQLGDYLILYLITKNLSPFIMKDVFDAIAPQHYSVPLQNATEEEKEPLKQPAYA